MMGQGQEKISVTRNSSIPKEDVESNPPHRNNYFPIAEHGADGDQAVYWSVLHHKNVRDGAPNASHSQDYVSEQQNMILSQGPHQKNEPPVPTIIQERQPFVDEFSPNPCTLTLYDSMSISPSVSPPNMPSHPVGSRVTRHSGWKRVKEAVQSKDLFITHIPDKGEAPGSRRKWSDLDSTTFEFSLRECFILFLALLAIGIIAYSFLFEHWAILDSVYFTVVLLTTVGYGDIAPTTPGGKLFASFFALVGVVVLGLALGVVGNRLVEAEIAYAEKMKSKTKNALEAAFASRSYLRRGRKEHVNRDTDATKRLLTRIDSTNSIGSDSASTLSEDSSLCSLITLKDASHIHMIHTHKNRRRNQWLSVVRRHLPGFALILVGGLIMSLLEHWEWQDAIYYCVITATTIGFGDLSPQTEGARWCAILFVPLVVAAMGYILGNFATLIVEQRRAEYIKKLWSFELTVEDIKALDGDHCGGVTELEYIKFMLVAMKKCDGELFDQLRKQFGELDMTRDGKITKKDLRLMASRKMKKVHNKLKLSSYKQQLLHQSS